MNRLTEKRDSGSWGVKGVDWKQIAPSAKITDEVWRKLYGALYKLKDYEDTGLMPDEIGKLNTEAQEEARKMLEKVAELSEEIEKAQEKTRWIPVTERLPEVSYNSMLGWDKNYRRSCLVQYNGYGFILPTGQYMDIIAWMPLPEPYRGKEE